MNLTELSKKIYQANKEKGFWDEERNVGELFMLIISECAEALEAHRKGKFADLEDFDAQTITIGLNDCFNVSDSFHKAAFEESIKDTFEDELADIVIRVLDFAGSRDLNVDIIDGNIEDLCGETNIGAMLCDICEDIIQTRFAVECNSSDKKISEMLRQVLRQLFAISDYCKIDLNRHIELKLKYNATRPYKHGKKY